MGTTRAALLSLTVLLTVVACGDGDTPDPGPSDGNIGLALLEAQKRLEACTRLPWIATHPTLRGPIANQRSRIQNHVFNASNADPTASTEAAKTLLAQFQGLEPMIAVLERLGPAANRIWRLEHDIQQMLKRMNVPDEATFPLRTRFQTGWLPDRGTHFGYLVVGLEAMMAGRRDDKLAVAAGNLDRLAGDGKELYDQFNRISRQIDIMQAKVVGLRQRIEWGRQVVRLATEKGGIEAVTLQTISAAADAAEKALPSFATNWDVLKLAFARDPKAARPAVLKLMADVDAHLLAISKAGHQTALKLGLLGPGR